MNRIANAFWWVLVSLCLLGSLVTTPFFLPYNQLKPLGDSISKDGHLETLTPGFYQAAKWPVLAIGLILLCAGVLLIARRGSVQARLAYMLFWLASMWNRLRLDSVVFLRDFRAVLPVRWELAGVLVIFVGAFIGRLFFIHLPIDYDEAYTFSEFAQYSFRQVITDYHVPNNHVLNTIFVRITFLIFGDAPWALRIPVFAAGMLLVVVVYVFAKKAYNTSTAFLSAGLVAAAPMLIYYSVTARGYIWVSLFAMSTFALGLYVRWHKNLLAWGLLILFTAAGFYAIPIMLYPYAILFTWLFFCGLSKDIHPQFYSFKNWLKYLVVASLLAGLLTVFLYSPILLKNGVLHFFNGAKVVDSLSLSAFITTLPAKVDEIAVNWRFRTTALVQSVLFLGIILSMVFQSRVSKMRFSIQAAMAIAMSVILVSQRPSSLPRIWLWLMPFLLVWAAAGFTGLFEWVTKKWKKAIYLQRSLLWTSLFLVMGSSLWKGWVESPRPGKIYPGETMEYVMRFIKPNLKPDDVVVSPRFYDAMFWYYGRYLDIPTSNYRAIKARPFYRAFVIVYPSSGDTVQTAISRDGPDIGFFNLESAKMVYTVNDGTQEAQVYTVDAIPEYVDKAYGVKKKETGP